ncbi:DUF2875 family protein [Azoarcus sp. DD4]|uniref:type VI lipase adapter Tla3 domain-containing protein n=1 Tax=Azoarcus sp. DD4 TaxID=2027405 RepID=UPI00143CDA32|nr:DUF2875 family protein [Azoarcus sp. DD4]
MSNGARTLTAIVLAITMLITLNQLIASYKGWAAGRAAGQTTPAQAPLPPAPDEAQQRRFALEVRGVGLAVDRLRQSGIWQAIDAADSPFQRVLSDDPADYEWSGLERHRDLDSREAYAAKSVLEGWVERWPIPVLVASPESRTSGSSRVRGAHQHASLPIHLATTLDSHVGEGADQLIIQLFDLFDADPQLPAVVLFGIDSEALKLTDAPDEHFVPDIHDAAAAILVARTDRVDRDIRPYLTDVPYDLTYLDKEYDVIQLWNAYWDADEDPAGPRHTDLGFMSTQFWQERQQKLIDRVDPNGGQYQLTPFWMRKYGFKPNPWVPVRWTKWQMEEYDKAPLLGYLHRPVEVPLDAPAGPKGDKARAAAMAEGWQQALDTLPEGTAPTRLFYDTAGEGRRLIPLSRAMSTEGTPHPLAIDDPANSYDLTRRLGNTGVSSPFVQLALALMRSYHHGGASATVNLREDARASIIMVRPPDDAQKAANRRRPDPFVNPYAPLD